MEPGEIERDLIPMIQRQKDSRKPFPISAAIYHDLRIGGDDAAELLVAVHERFGTSFSEMHFPTYFPNETDVLWHHWAYLLGFPDKARPRVTVAHLIAVIERGHWFAP